MKGGGQEIFLITNQLFHMQYDGLYHPAESTYLPDTYYLIDAATTVVSCPVTFAINFNCISIFIFNTKAQLLHQTKIYPRE